MFQIFSKSKPKQVQSLSEEQKVIVEEYLEDDIKASEISEKTGYDLVMIRRHVDLLRKRKERQQSKQPFQNDELRELKEQIKIQELQHQLDSKKERQSLEMEKLKLDIEIKKSELYDYDDEEYLDSNDPMGWLNIANDFLGIYKKANQGNQIPLSNVPTPDIAPQNNTISEVETLPAELELSDEDICKLLEEIKANNPTYLEMAKTMDESIVINFVKSRYPYSDKTIIRAVEILKDPKVLEANK